MLRDEGCSIRHRVEQWPKGSVAAPIVVRVKDARLDVYCHNLDNKHYDLFNPAVERKWILLVNVQLDALR